MDGTAISYATSKDWLDIMKNRSKVRMHELIERLGLRAKWSSNKRGKTNFESVLVRELVTDMGEIVSTLPKEPDDLVDFLGRPGSLRNEVDVLLEKHGSRVWGRSIDREHLITATEPGVEDGVYSRDLYIEEEEDRLLIHKLLHWWIGLKACNVILARERLDRERRKKAENRQARIEAEHANQHADGTTPASFVALAPNSVLHDVDTGSRGSPVSSSAMLTPPESGESPIVGPRETADFMTFNGKDEPSTIVQSHQGNSGQNIVEGVWSRFAASERHSAHDDQHSWPPAPPDTADGIAAVQHRQAMAQQQAATERQITVDLAQMVASFRSDDTQFEDVPHPNHSVPYKGLEYDSLRALRSYIYEEESSVLFEEDNLLNRLEKTWREYVRGDYERIAEDPLVFIARERAFLTWIEMRRHLAAFDRAHQRWSTEGKTAAEINRRHQQYDSLMRASETILVNYEDIGHGLDVAPGTPINKDELLRQAVVVLAGKKYAEEMQWQTVEFTVIIKWLAEALDSFRKDEEEEDKGAMWFVG